MNDESVNEDNFEEKIRGLVPTNEIERDFISNALDVAKYSRSFWEANNSSSDLKKGRDWVVWGADVWGSAVAGIGAGTLSVNPLVGFVAGVAGGELMSACVGAVRNPR